MTKDKNLSWNEAIIAVLDTAGTSMHYADIANAIVAKNLRKKVGATPAISVNTVINSNINKYGEKSPFIKTGGGEYFLNKKNVDEVTEIPDIENDDDIVTNGSILTSFGMYWRRELVAWENPKLLGKYQAGTQNVDFSNQKGIYLLHDGRDIVYIGRVIDQTLKKRLRDHTGDRFNGRWNRFSWFGFLPVTPEGKLIESPQNSFPSGTIIQAMEALLIEAIEPPLNRKRGDDLGAYEYLQVEDEQIRQKQYQNFLAEIQTKLKAG